MSIEMLELAGRLEQQAKLRCLGLDTQELLQQAAAALRASAVAEPVAPAAAPTREKIAESAALSTWERIIRQFFADGRGRVSAEKALDAILALKSVPAK